jgi:hypothetical protein
MRGYNMRVHIDRVHNKVVMAGLRPLKGTVSPD